MRYYYTKIQGLRMFELRFKTFMVKLVLNGNPFIQLYWWKL